MTDYLTKLPTELFLDICQRIQDAKQGPYLGAISKAFLPFAREATFGKSTIRTYERLQKLCDLAKDRAVGIASIQTLYLELKGQSDDGTPRSTDLTNLFARLGSVETLHVVGSARVAMIVLAPTGHRRLLPRLLTLQIDDPLEGWANPFALTHYANLDHYRKLVGLDLYIERTRASLGRYRTAKQPEWRPFSWMVTLRGPVLGNPAARDFIRWLRAPYILFLHDLTLERSDDSFASILEDVQEPEGVRSLGFLRVSEPAEELSGALARFPNLFGVEFRKGSFSSKCISTLSHMRHLGYIDFMYGASVTVKDLRKLVSPPFKPPQLKAISLNLVWDNWADYARTHGGEPEDYAWQCAIEGVPRYQGWRDDFSLKDLADFVDAADKEGFQTKSLAVDLAREELTRRRKAAAASNASRQGRL